MYILSCQFSGPVRPIISFGEDQCFSAVKEVHPEGKAQSSFKTSLAFPKGLKGWHIPPEAGSDLMYNRI